MSTGKSRNNKSNAGNNGDIAPPPPPDEGPSPFVQEGVPQKKLRPASVTYLDGKRHAFYVHRKAEGEVLFDLVCTHLVLTEKDYFGLVYYDEHNIQNWLRKDKKIGKQLKGRSWEFNFEVKFYPQPSQLTEECTRYLLYLQLRRDVYTNKLPASFKAQASLGSLVAQAEYGDFRPTSDYKNHFLEAKLAQTTPDQEDFIEKVKELHIKHRGLSAREAEFAYLNECKELAMYGMRQFPAKDSKGKPVSIGVNAHGIYVYVDQMRIHRFAWAGINRFSYRRSNFYIKLRAGEVDPKKEATLNYKLQDHELAKLLYRCGAEHHTFFRLVQPEMQSKRSFFSFGSSRGFHYSGRTNIQTQMASQLFDSTTQVSADRTNDSRIGSKSADPIAQKEHASPMHFADDGSRDFATSPGKSFIGTSPLAASTAKKPAKKKADEKGAGEVGDLLICASSIHVDDEHCCESIVEPTTTSTAAKFASKTEAFQITTSSKATVSLHLPSPSEIPSLNLLSSPNQSSSNYASATDEDDDDEYSSPREQFNDSGYSELISPDGGAFWAKSANVKISTVTSVATVEVNGINGEADNVSTLQQQQQRRSVHFNDDEVPKKRSWFGARRRGAPAKVAAKKASLTLAKSGADEEYLVRQSELPNISIGSYVQLYNEGIYQQEKITPTTNGTTNAFRGFKTSIFWRPNNALIIPKQFSSSDTAQYFFQNRAEELPEYYIKYFVRTYHSGYSIPPYKKYVNMKIKCRGEKATVSTRDYDLDKTKRSEHERLEKRVELPTLALRQFCVEPKPGRLQQKKRVQSEVTTEEQSHLIGASTSVQAIVLEDPRSSVSKARTRVVRFTWTKTRVVGASAPISMAESVEEVEVHPVSVADLKKYEGPMKELSLQNDMEEHPLRAFVQPYNSGQSFKLTKSEGYRSDGDELEQPELKVYYVSDNSPYEGQIRELKLAKEMTTLPLRRFVRRYHSGRSVESSDEDAHEDSLEVSTPIKKDSVKQRLASIMKHTQNITVTNHFTKPQLYEDPLKSLSISRDPECRPIKFPVKIKNDVSHNQTQRPLSQTITALFYTKKSSNKSNKNAKIILPNKPNTSLNLPQSVTFDLSPTPHLNWTPLLSSQSVQTFRPLQLTNNEVNQSTFVYLMHFFHKSQNSASLTYQINSTPYSGPLELLNKFNDLECEPISKFVSFNFVNNNRARHKQENKQHLYEIFTSKFTRRFNPNPPILDITPYNGPLHELILTKDPEFPLMPEQQFYSSKSLENVSSEFTVRRVILRIIRQRSSKIPPSDFSAKFDNSRYEGPLESITFSPDISSEQLELVTPPKQFYQPIQKRENSVTCWFINRKKTTRLVKPQKAAGLQKSSFIDYLRFSPVKKVMKRSNTDDEKPNINHRQMNSILGSTTNLSKSPDIEDLQLESFVNIKDIEEFRRVIAKADKQEEVDELVELAKVPIQHKKCSITLYTRNVEEKSGNFLKVSHNEEELTETNAIENFAQKLAEEIVSYQFNKEELMSIEACRSEVPVENVLAKISVAELPTNQQHTEELKLVKTFKFAFPFKMHQEPTKETIYQQRTGSFNGHLEQLSPINDMENMPLKSLVEASRIGDKALKTSSNKKMPCLLCVRKYVQETPYQLKHPKIYDGPLEVLSPSKDLDYVPVEFSQQPTSKLAEIPSELRMPNDDDRTTKALTILRQSRDFFDKNLRKTSANFNALIRPVQSEKMITTDSGTIATTSTVFNATDLILTTFTTSAEANDLTLDITLKRREYAEFKCNAFIFPICSPQHHSEEWQHSIMLLPGQNYIIPLRLSLTTIATSIKDQNGGTAAECGVEDRANVIETKVFETNEKDKKTSSNLEHGEVSTSCSTKKGRRHKKSKRQTAAVRGENFGAGTGDVAEDMRRGDTGLGHFSTKDGVNIPPQFPNPSSQKGHIPFSPIDDQLPSTSANANCQTAVELENSMMIFRASTMLNSSDLAAVSKRHGHSKSSNKEKELTQEMNNGLAHQQQQDQDINTTSNRFRSPGAILRTIRRRLSQHIGAGESKEAKKARKREKKAKEKDSKAKKQQKAEKKAKKVTVVGGVTVATGRSSSSSSSSMTSSSDSDVEEVHLLHRNANELNQSQQQQNDITTQTQQAHAKTKHHQHKSKNQQSGGARIPSSQSATAAIPEKPPRHSTSSPTSDDALRRSSGPYTPASDSVDGRVIREERTEQVYRIIGTGANVPQVDPKDASLSGTLSKCLGGSSNSNNGNKNIGGGCGGGNGEKPPVIQMIDKATAVRESEPVPPVIKEASLPHTTVHTWHESTTSPETVTMEKDEYGNVIKRIYKTEQMKHTVKTQSFQTFAVDENAVPHNNSESTSFAAASNQQQQPPAMETHLQRTRVYENGTKVSGTDMAADEDPGELVSTKAITTGNRTIETLTYKKEKDGVVETRVEHRITIHSGGGDEEIDHDAELSRAILEATNMNPAMKVEKVDLKQGTLENPPK